MKEVRPAEGLGSIYDNDGTPTSKILVAFFTVISTLSKILGMSPIQYDKVKKNSYIQDPFVQVFGLIVVSHFLQFAIHGLATYFTIWWICEG
jgi:phosphatidylserine synthase